MSQQTISSFSFQGFIWKIITNKLQDHLVLEVRDELSRRVSISKIDLTSRKIKWDQSKLQEKWWISLDKLTKGEVILHGYKSPQNPESLGIYALDFATGNILWENRNQIYINASDSSILAKDLEDNFILIDSRSGKLQSKLTQEDAVKWQYDGFPSQPITAGNIYTEENVYYARISQAVKVLAGNIPSGPLEYLESNGKIIISYYLIKGENLVNYLLVCNEDGRILYHEAIASEIKTAASESFFVMNSLLIFVKNKKELIIFEL